MSLTKKSHPSLPARSLRRRARARSGSPSTARRPLDARERILTTLLFTDIVRSTNRAARLGDSGWCDLLAEHNRLVRSQLRHWRGREIKTMGDGFLALFGAPTRAINCACVCIEAMRQFGIELRVGVHSGECDLIDDLDIAGMAVNVGARVLAQAEPSEVLVSGTVKDLILGSEVCFADRGMHVLRGVPGTWPLFSVERAIVRAQGRHTALALAPG